MIINKNKILKALKRVNAFISNSGINPILSNLLIRIWPLSQEVEISATDLDNYYIGRFAAMDIIDSDKCEFMIDNKIFAGVLESLKNTDVKVEIDMDARQITFMAAGAEITLPIMDGDDFPAVSYNSVKEKALFSGTKMFIDAFRAVKYCTSKELTKPAFAGIHINIQEKLKRLVVTATDGKRLAQAICETNLYLAKEAEYIVKPSFLAEWSACLDEMIKEDSACALALLTDELHFHFRTASEYFYSRLIEGKFPDASQVIPKAEAKVTIQADKKNLIENLDTLKFVAKDNAYSISCNIAGRKLTLESKSKGRGSKIRIDCKAQTEGELKTNFNMLYWRDALSALNDDDVKIELTTNQAPLKIHEVKDEVEYYHVLMPVRPSYVE